MVDRSGAKGAGGKPRKGRGATFSPAPRYVELEREGFDDGWGSADEAPAALHTTVTEERVTSLINRARSRDRD